MKPKMWLIEFRKFIRAKICDYAESWQKKIRNHWLSWTKIPIYGENYGRTRLTIQYFLVSPPRNHCPLNPDFVILDSVLPDWIQVLDDPYSDLYYEPKIFIQGTIRNNSNLLDAIGLDSWRDLMWVWRGSCMGLVNLSVGHGLKWNKEHFEWQIKRRIGNFISWY